MYDENQNSWEPQDSRGRQTDNDSDYVPYSYYAAEKRKKKHTGLLVVLTLLALLTGAASWAVNVLGVQVDIGQKGVVLAIGEVQQKAESEQLSQPEADAALTEVTPPAEPHTPEETAEEPEADAVLEIQTSPASVENRPAAEADALSLQQIYKKVAPSVASISCVLSNGTASGTGIVMSEDGYIITNYHVIESAQAIYVLLDEDATYQAALEGGDEAQTKPATAQTTKTYQAALVGGDETSDLAVLKVDASGLLPAEFGDSDVLQVGDLVVAIGDPLGAELRGTMTDGIISAINRDLSLNGRQMTLIQTNAALNSGNSGGPLINCYGQVIGINTMKMSNYSSASATVEGLGFAIPITAAKPILDELIEQGYVSGRPAIGITGQTLDLRAQFFYQMPPGVVITSVKEDSDAAVKGLEPDDVIVGLNQTKITSLEDLVSAKSQCDAGDTVTLTIYRGGKYYEVDVVLMDQVSPDIY